MMRKPGGRPGQDVQARWAAWTGRLPGGRLGRGARRSHRACPGGEKNGDGPVRRPGRGGSLVPPAVLLPIPAAEISPEFPPRFSFPWMEGRCDERFMGFGGAGASGGLRLRRLPAGAGGGDPGDPGGPRRAGGDADGRREVAVFPTAGAGARRADGGGLAADRADEGPGRCAGRARREGGGDQLDAVRDGDVGAARRDGGGRVPARLHRPGAVPERPLRPRALPGPRRALRPRRGALHLAMGA